MTKQNFEKMPKAELLAYVKIPGIIHSRSKKSLSMSWARKRSALVREL